MTGYQILAALVLLSFGGLVVVFYSTPTPGRHEGYGPQARVGAMLALIGCGSLMTLLVSILVGWLR